MTTGFSGAPVAKLLFLVSAAGSCLLQAARARSSTLGWLWRHKAANPFAFRHPAEAAFGLLLQYYFRVFEGQVGTAKFGAYVLASLGTQQLLGALLAGTVGLSFAAGPYVYLFASLVEYTLNVPPAQHFELFGWRLTNKVCFCCSIAHSLCALEPCVLLVQYATGLHLPGIIAAALVLTQNHCPSMSHRLAVWNSILGCPIGPTATKSKASRTLPSAALQTFTMSRAYSSACQLKHYLSNLQIPPVVAHWLQGAARPLRRPGQPAQVHHHPASTQQQPSSQAPVSVPTPFHLIM